MITVIAARSGSRVAVERVDQLFLEETVNAVLDAVDGTDRTVLRIKPAGAPDSALATALNVSGPTAAKRKSEAFDRWRAAWVRASASGASESILLAEELYTRLHITGSTDA